MHTNMVAKKPNEENNSVIEIIKDAQILVVSFSGNGLNNIGNLPTFEFKNFLTSTFPSISLLFLKDNNVAWYNKGIENISSDVESTLIFLRKKISAFEKVIFIGSSSGGYAAILFGSLLNVNMVIAFRPQTLVSEKFINPKYKDLKTVINKSTLYYIFGETCNEAGTLHSFEHCENIAISKNVYIDKREVLNLKSLRDDGGLKTLFLDLFSKI